MVEEEEKVDEIPFIIAEGTRCVCTLEGVR